MNFFKKALIAILSVGLVTVPATREVETVEAVSASEDTTMYLVPNSNWTKDGARFAIYTWGGSSGEKWISLYNGLGNKYYFGTLPKGYENIIFARMDGNNSSNSWNTKWNQTSDLKYDGTNYTYSVKAGTWDSGGGNWTKYPDISSLKYSLIGSWNGWGSDYLNLTFDSVNLKFSTTEKVKISKDVEFKIRETNDTSWSKPTYGKNNLTEKNDYVDSKDDNILIKLDGYYDISIDLECKIVIERYFKINFADKNGGSYGDYYTLYNDGTFANKEAPTKEGYTFVCWEDEFGNEVTQVTEDDTTLYAKWEPNEYGVTFKVADQTLDKTGTYGESLETVLPTSEELKAKGYNVLSWDKDLSSTITGNTEVTATSYYKYFEAKAELGFGYEYDENGEITAVNNMKARFGSDYVSLDSFVGLDITEYGIRLDKGDKMTENPYVKTWKYTSELDDEGKPLDNEVGKFTYNSETKEYKEIKDKEEVPTHIRWALTINNIPESYYNGNFTYECFIVVDGGEYTVSNRRTVSVVSLAETYAGMDSIAEGHKKACQFIADGKYAVAA